MSFLRALSLDFDVIISNGEVANFFGLLLSKIRSRPVVMVSHGQASCQPQYNPVIRSVFRLADRLTYQNADAVVTHAPRQLAGLAKRYSVVMPGLDRLRLKRLPGPERRRLKARYAPSGEKIILFTGRLIAVKGVEYLLRSLRHVRQKHVCIIAGDGPDMEKLRRLAASERANVVFTGFSKDVSALLSIADVFALPSLSESLNYSLVEAAFMGVPIACTDIGIISSREAFLARPRDERSLADAISHALSAGNGKMLKRARKYAESFDWDATAEKYIRIMEGVLA
jgi:glycosyltransferase involved in cell wall biosynthesis